MNWWWVLIGAIAIVQVTTVILLIYMWRMNKNLRPYRGMDLADLLLMLATELLAAFVLVFLAMEVLAVGFFLLATVLTRLSEQLLKMPFLPKGLLGRIHKRNQYLSRRWKENVKNWGRMVQDLPKQLALMND